MVFSNPIRSFLASESNSICDRFAHLRLFSVKALNPSSVLFLESDDIPLDSQWLFLGLDQKVKVVPRSSDILGSHLWFCSFVRLSEIFICESLGRYLAPIYLPLFDARNASG